MSKLRKFIYIFPAIAVVLAGIIFLLFFINDGDLNLAIKTKTESRYPRNYPATIKGMVEPGVSQMERLIRQDLHSIKELGVNTVSIYPYYEYRNGILELQVFGKRATSIYMDTARLARTEGFAVFLSPNLVGPSGQKLDNISLEKYLQDSKKIAVEWAKIAEDENVEYFAPQGEIDVQIMINYYGSQWGNETAIKEVSEIINKWHAELLPNIEKVYTGKTVYHTGMSRFDFRRADGYDYLAIDFNQNGFTLQDFRKYARQTYKEVDTAAVTSNSDWFVAEAWFPYNRFGTTNNDGESFEPLQDDYYRISLEEFYNFGSARKHGYMFNSYTTEGMDIKDRPAEAVIKEFYNLIGE